MGGISHKIAKKCNEFTMLFCKLDSNSSFTSTETQQTHFESLLNTSHNIPMNEKKQDIPTQSHRVIKPIQYPIASTKRTNTDIISTKKKPISLNDFEIIRLIGAGAFGKVFMAQYKKDGRTYAMKILQKESVKKRNQIRNTRTEREILEVLDHPFIIKLIWAFQDLNRLYIITDLMSGGDLMNALKTRGKFNEEQARFYACEILIAIDYLHKNRIIFRDLKPENVLLDVKGHIKLTDFGLSKKFEEEDQPDQMRRRTYSLCGTKQYLSPEVILGFGYSYEIDWWAFGIVLFQMLTGKFPFSQRKKESQVNLNIIDLSPSGHNLLFLLLHPDRNKRLTDSSQIKSHSFFQGVNWSEVESLKTNPPLIIHQMSGKLNFDKRFTENKVEVIKMTEVSRNIQPCFKSSNPSFENFSFDRQRIVSGV